VTAGNRDPADQHEGDGISGRKVRRRRIFAGIGASGIATAVAVFGRSTPASADYTYACCHLSFRPTYTVAQCKSGNHYIWYCWHAGYVRCQCCEVKDGYGYDVASAYSCN
jgi:hypothetical protein